MQVKPVASPAAIQQAPSNAQAAKARAVAAFQAASPAQASQPVVQNQNSISPEEMGAIRAPERQEDSIVEQEQVAEEIEAATPPEPEKPKEDPALSRQFAQLARQERALRAKAQQQEQSLRAREAALQAREQELNSKDQTYKQGYISRDTLKQDPLSILAEAGISYEELTQQIMSQQPVDPRLQNTIGQLKQQIQELKQANDDAKKSYAENQTQAYQAAVKQITSDVKQLVSSDPNYEAIRATGSTKDVVDLIERTFNKDGILLSVEEAAQKVEDYLVEESLKLTRIEKIKRKMQEVAPKASSRPAQPQAANQQKQPQPMKTLTNATSSTRQLSAKERAILAFKGELKP